MKDTVSRKEREVHQGRYQEDDCETDERIGTNKKVFETGALKYQREECGNPSRQKGERGAGEGYYSMWLLH